MTVSKLPRDYKHADIVKACINKYKLIFSSFKELNEGRFDLIEDRFNEMYAFECEAPYNYYGERGSVDLVVYRYKTLPRLFLHEVKTQLFDIGELLRQIHKLMKYFVKARKEIQGVKILENIGQGNFLVFSDTKENWEIFNRYYDFFIQEANLLIYIATDRREGLSKIRQVFGPPYIRSIAEFEEGLDFVHAFVRARKMTRASKP